MPPVIFSRSGTPMDFKALVTLVTTHFSQQAHDVWPLWIEQMP